MRGIATSLVVVMLCGCASTANKPEPLEAVLKKGTRFTIAKPINRDPFNRAIYFQDGNLHSWWDPDAWQTLCRLRVGHGVNSDSLMGSIYEVTSVSSSSTQNSDLAQGAGISLDLRTISGASAENLRCDLWYDLTSSPIDAYVTLEDFEDAVGAYIKILGDETAPDAKQDR